MHELGIAQGILDIAVEHARREPGRQVRSIQVAIGALSCVDTQALAFGWEAVARGSVAEGSRLEIERKPGRGFCVPCGQELEVRELGAPCLQCGHYQWLLISGDELKVLSMEVL